MKNLIFILFTLCTFGLISCGEETFDSDSIRMDVNFSKRGVYTVVRIAVRGIDAKKIEHCGIQWETRIPILPNSLQISNQVIEIEAEGDQLDYEFEVFPWDHIFVDDPDVIKTCALCVLPYIVVNGYKYSGPNTRYHTVENPMDIYVSDSPVQQERDLLVSCRFSFPKRKEEIEECGIYWYSEPDKPREGQFVMCGKEDGNYEALLKNAALFDSTYTRGYVKTALGIYYSAPKSMASNAGDMRVNFNNVYDVTFEEVTVSATITPTNEEAFPVLTKGFCYIQIDNNDILSLPTIDDYKITAGSGAGHMVEQIKGLRPESTYRIRAYAINDKGIIYSLAKTTTTKTK